MWIRYISFSLCEPEAQILAMVITKFKSNHLKDFPKKVLCIFKDTHTFVEMIKEAKCI